MTLVRNNINAIQTKMHMDDSEFQVLSLRLNGFQMTLVNMYSPNDKALSLDSIPMEATNLMVVGDFNSHSQSWGYDHMDNRGEEVETWQDDNRLNLINQPEDPPTFYSRRWHSTSTPDLAFCTDDIHGHVQRKVTDQLGGSDHRPVLIILDRSVSMSSSLPRWNYKKADWPLFQSVSDELCKDIRVEGRDINNIVRDFNQCILKSAQQSIPRGARKDYKPYWSEQLEELQTKVSEARVEAENNPSQEANHNLQHAKAKFLRHKLEAQRKSWRHKTASLNLERDGRKLWRLTKQLNDDQDKARGSVTLEEEGELLVGKQAANVFAQNYKDVSDIPINSERLREARREQRDRKTPKVTSECMDSRLTLHEVQAALRQLKTKKSPGPDGITNEMLTHLGNTAMCKLLDIYNYSWKQGQLPQIWREATMIPILKKGKDPKKAASYRPISLTSCVVKTMERIVNARLKWYLETNDLLASEQAGFRQFRSTEDQTTYLAQEVEDAFQEQKVVLTAWIDLQRAFDKVWTEGLQVKLMRNGVGGAMLKWINSYLFNRRARVSLNQSNSRKFLLRHGVPQGGVLSPTLFLVFINDLVSELPKGVHAALYADDLVLWCKEEHASTATYRMQRAMDTLAAWAEDWCVTINKEKSSTTLFTLSTKQRAGKVMLAGTPLKEEDEATYLGVTFDKRQTWKAHISRVEGTARRKLGMMRKLAGTTWGANEQILKTVYQGTVRPTMEYSSATWSTTAKTNQQALDKVQNQALRIITGATKSTPIAFMEKLTGIQTLHERRQTKVLLQANKYQSLPDHPMNSRLEGFTKNRLKRCSFVHQAKKLSREYAAELNTQTIPLGRADITNPTANDLSAVKVALAIPGLDMGKQENETIRRSLTLAAIYADYPSDTWTHVYTDGSATRAVKDGGGGIHITYPSGQKTAHYIATGKHCSNYRAETEALMKAVFLIENSPEEITSVVFLTDARSVLEALQNNNVPELAQAVNKLGSSCNVALQWIPSHCGVPGNEEADKLARLGAQLEQPDNQVTYKEKATIIKALTKTRQEADAYHMLNRPEQVVMVRLRSGHNRLNAHMCRKYKLVPSPICPCGEEDQTTEHILQRCKRHDQERGATWPRGATLQQKLYGDVEDLRRTTTFIADTGVIV